MENSKNKKVGIVTMTYNTYNYGSYLQGFALKEFINSIGGYDCDILRVNPDNGAIGSRLERILSKQGIRGLITKITKKIYVKFAKHKGINIRDMIFKEAVEEITAGEIYTRSADFSEVNDLYDIFVAGSDQIWSDSQNNLNAIDIFFLSGINRPKISYAPSIGGGADFNPELVSHIVPLLKEFKNISVRENAGKLFLQKILGDKTPIFHALDPSLLFSSVQWDNLISLKKTCFAHADKAYIFVYLLGHMREHRDLIKKFAALTGLPVISFPHLQTSTYTKYDSGFSDIEIFDATPEDFLLYIKNSKYVFTDSFHGALFSGLYHKEFFVFKKDGFGGRYETQFERIENLLELYGSQNRYISNFAMDAGELNIISSDWEQTDKNIDARRSECQGWLKAALIL